MIKDIVTYDNKLNEIPLTGLNSTEAKIFWAIVSRLGNKGRKELRIKRKDLNVISGLLARRYPKKTWVTKVNSLTNKLCCIEIKQELAGASSITMFSLFDKFVVTEEHITVQASEYLEPWLNNLTGNFTTFELSSIVGLGSLYSQEIYRRLMQWRTIRKNAELPGYWAVSLEEFKSLLSIPKSYSLSEIQSRIIDKTIEELTSESGPLEVLIANREISTGRIRGCSGFSFSFKEKSSTPNEAIAARAEERLKKLEKQKVDYSNNFKNGYIAGLNSPANAFVNWTVSCGIRKINDEYFEVRSEALNSMKDLYKKKVLSESKVWTDMTFLCCVIYVISNDKAMVAWNLEDAYFSLKKTSSKVDIPSSFLDSLPSDKLLMLSDFIGY